MLGTPREDLLLDLAQPVGVLAFHAAIRPA
jgi:hypothetical protein